MSTREILNWHHGIARFVYGRVDAFPTKVGALVPTARVLELSKDAQSRPNEFVNKSPRLRLHFLSNSGNRIRACTQSEILSGPGVLVAERNVHSELALYVSPSTMIVASTCATR